MLLCLSRQGHGFTDIEDLLHHRSGLLGVSGISGDIGELLASAAGAPCISRPDSAVEVRVIETDEESRDRATHEGDDPTNVRTG